MRRALNRSRATVLPLVAISPRIRSLVSVPLDLGGAIPNSNGSVDECGGDCLGGALVLALNRR